MVVVGFYKMREILWVVVFCYVVSDDFIMKCSSINDLLRYYVIF